MRLLPASAIWSNSETCPLTCPIAKGPVRSKQFTELRLTAFEMLGHLGQRRYDKAQRQCAAQVDVEGTGPNDD